MLILSDGDKGGVGKSFLAKALGDYCRRQGLPVHYVETDTRNPDIYQVANKIIPTERYDLRNDDGWAALAHLAEDCAAQENVIVSLPGGIGAQEQNYACFIQAMEEIGIEMRVFWVMNHEKDSVNLLKHRISQDKALAQSMVAVLNCFYDEAFSIWNGSQTRNDFLGNGGTEYALPCLAKRVTEHLARENKLLSEGMDTLHAYDRIVFRTWRKKLDEGLSALNLPLVGKVA